jgi:hypothetical protein
MKSILRYDNKTDLLTLAAAAAAAGVRSQNCGRC